MLLNQLLRSAINEVSPDPPDPPDSTACPAVTTANREAVPKQIPAFLFAITAPTAFSQSLGIPLALSSMKYQLKKLGS